MFGIGRKIKKDLVVYLLKVIKNKFSKKTYSFFLFLSVFRKFKKEINKKKKFDKFSNDLQKINDFEYRITSQNNEDGIIEHIFSKIPNNKFFIELGFDFFECNTLNLIKEGWSGILVDANEDNCLKMKNCLKYFFPKNKVKVINQKINRENINKLIYSYIDRKKIDFFSIDLDGNDYWILEKLITENINVICNEYNPWIGNDVKKTIHYNENFKYNSDFYFGASLNAYSSLLNSKNFNLIAVESSGTNSFFVKKELSSNFKTLIPKLCYKKASRVSEIDFLKIKKFIDNCDFLKIND